MKRLILFVCILFIAFISFGQDIYDDDGNWLYVNITNIEEEVRTAPMLQDDIITIGDQLYIAPDDLRVYSELLVTLLRIENLIKDIDTIINPPVESEEDRLARIRDEANRIIDEQENRGDWRSLPIQDKNIVLENLLRARAI